MRESINREATQASQVHPMEAGRKEWRKFLLVRASHTITSIWNIECVPRVLRFRFDALLTFFRGPRFAPEPTKSNRCRVLALLFGCKHSILNLPGSDVNDEFRQLCRVAGTLWVVRQPSTPD